MIDSSLFETRTVSFHTLGCKLNFAESSAIGRSLLEMGMRIAAEGESPDLCVVNTCSVTELADKKSRQLIRKLHRDHPSARIIVTGCYAQLKPDEVAQIEGVDLVLGNNEKVDLGSFLGQLPVTAADRAPHTKVLHTPVGEIRQFAPSVSSEGRTRHFLKVQDGCDYTCSYCTIPKARGRSRNGSIEELVAQAHRVVVEGGKEIILTGVNVGDFGRSTGESFLELLQALDQVEGIARYRISSIEPNLITDQVIHFVSASERFAPHFHIPLQSGSNEVLRLMRRRYTRELFADKVVLIKDLLPDAYIGVDVIVGMRGETDSHFESTRQFISELPISKLHVFSYSERPGTYALQIDHSVPPGEKHRRSQQLIALSDAKLADFNAGQQRKIRQILFEHRADRASYLYGYSENYVRVRIPFAEGLEGTLRAVCIGAALSDERHVMACELLPDHV